MQKEKLIMAETKITFFSVFVEKNFDNVSNIIGYII